MANPAVARTEISWHPPGPTGSATTMDAADFYTGIVAVGYALLKTEDFPADRYADFIRASAGP